jgi:hypothetical protein
MKDPGPTRFAAGKRSGSMLIATFQLGHEAIALEEAFGDVPEM